MKALPHVAGIDGCRGGWVVIDHPAATPGAARCRIQPSFTEALASLPTRAVIAIDIPIGLPDRIVGAGRPCDRAVRALLGPRRASVFTLPARAAVFAETYAAACDIAFATSDPPRKISKQAFFLFAKVREVDAAMTPELQNRIVECHPEAAFAVLNNTTPLLHPKKRKGRLDADGIALRQHLLTAAGYKRELLETCPVATKIAGLDDILDATANAAAAARIADDRGICFPAGAAARDSRGLKMQIWAWRRDRSAACCDGTRHA